MQIILYYVLVQGRVHLKPEMPNLHMEETIFCKKVVHSRSKYWLSFCARDMKTKEVFKQPRFFNWKYGVMIFIQRFSFSLTECFNLLKNVLRKNAECIEMINIDVVACQWERNISDALTSPKCKIWKFVTTEQHVSKRVR